MELVLDTVVAPVPRDTSDFSCGTSSYSDDDDVEDDDDIQVSSVAGLTGLYSEDDYEPLIRRPRLSLPIFEPPEFTKRLNSFVEAEVGATVVFECHYKALPRPKVTWLLDDTAVQPEEDDHIHVNVIEVKGILQLIIDGCRKRDEGAYKCKIENVEGSASTTGYLSVTGEDDKNIAQQKKKVPKAVKEGRSVSLPPHLRTIVEQKSLEEREYEVTKALPPSPIQDFIDLAITRRPGTWPREFLHPSDYERENGDKEGERSSSVSSDTSVESQAGSEPQFDLMSDEEEEEGEGDDRERVHSPSTPGNKPYWAYTEDNDDEPNGPTPSKTTKKAERQSRSRQPKLKLTRSAALSDQDSSSEEEESLDDDVFMEGTMGPQGLENRVVLVPDPTPEPPERGDSLNLIPDNSIHDEEAVTADSASDEDAAPAEADDQVTDAADAAPISGALSKADGAIIQTFTPQVEIALAAGGCSSQLVEPDSISHRADTAATKTDVEIKDIAAAAGGIGEACVKQRASGAVCEQTAGEAEVGTKPDLEQPEETYAVEYQIEGTQVSEQIPEEAQSAAVAEADEEKQKPDQVHTEESESGVTDQNSEEQQSVELFNNLEETIPLVESETENTVTADDTAEETVKVPDPELQESQAADGKLDFTLAEPSPAVEEPETAEADPVSADETLTVSEPESQEAQLPSEHPEEPHSSEIIPEEQTPSVPQEPDKPADINAKETLEVLEPEPEEAQSPELREQTSSVTSESADIICEENTKSKLYLEEAPVQGELKEAEQEESSVPKNIEPTETDPETVEAENEDMETQLLVNVTEEMISGTDESAAAVLPDPLTASCTSLDLPGEITVTFGITSGSIENMDAPMEFSSDTLAQTGYTEETETTASPEQTNQTEEMVSTERGSEGVLELSNEDLLTLNMSPVVRKRKELSAAEDDGKSATQADDEFTADSSPQSGSKPKNVKLRDNRARLRHKRAALSKVLSKSFETGTLPMIDWDAFFDLLDSFWIYYIVLSVLAAFAASATGMSPFYLILIVALLSFIGFSLLSSLDETVEQADSIQQESGTTSADSKNEASSSDAVENNDSIENEASIDNIATSSNIPLESEEFSGKDSASTDVCSNGRSAGKFNTEQSQTSSSSSDTNPTTTPIEPALD